MEVTEKMDLKCPKCSKSFKVTSEFIKHGKVQHKMSETELNTIVDWLGSLEAKK